MARLAATLKQLAAKIPPEINWVLRVDGHTDRLGSAQANQKLSERRAAAVKAYLVSKGMNAAQIETYGYGKTTPKKSCPDQKDRRQMDLCLAENRRVEVELQGAPR